MKAALRPLWQLPAAAAIGLLAMACPASAQNVAINNTGAAAAPTALLDISSVTHGLLIPRMNNMPPSAGLPQGFTMYKLVFSGGYVPGFYVWEYGQWMPLVTGNTGWDIYGNYLSNPANPNPDFIGTTDSAAMYFRTDNLHRMRLDGTTGHLGVGYPAAPAASVERLDVNGAIRQYYVPPNPGVETSNTSAAGVFRYQTYGTVTGSGANRYGTNERLATVGAGDNVPVLNTNKSYPLQYAAHWGNVDGTPMVQGKATPTLVQPTNGGWRAFENPYTEFLAKGWNQGFKEAVCAPAGAVKITNPPGNIWSDAAALTAADQIHVNPFQQKYNGQIAATWRRQYLFHVDELNAELNQLKNGPGAGVTGGLCPGEEIDSIAFFVKAPSASPTPTRALGGSPSFSVTVRHAPSGLDSLNGGFNYTPDFYGTPSCNTPAPSGSTWPSATGNPYTQVVTLNPPFKWDGIHNILIEVALKVSPASAATTPSPVLCSNTGFPATYAATYTGSPPVPLDPASVQTPPSSCWVGSNVYTLMTSTSPTSNYFAGSSTWRPIVEFRGTVSTVSGLIPTGSANYISYPGALVLEDPAGAVAGIPWGRWRSGYPAGVNYSAYQGNGTISAQRGVFDNTSRLNDFVFDRAFDGRVAPQDALEHGTQHLLPIEQMAEFTRKNRHLPTMKGRNDWNTSGGFSLGDLSNQLWATTEIQALYVADLHDKLNVIEILSTDRPINAKEFITARQDLTAMPGLTDAEKARLVADLRKRSPHIPAPSP